MTSLEFIEKEIKELEFQINYIKSNMEKYIDFRTEGQIEVDMNQLKINHLQQIKTILETWEELKPEIKEHKEVLYEDELTNALVFALPYSANPKKYNAIKKAMEVSDEKIIE